MDENGSLTEKGFIFLDETRTKAFQCRLIEGTPWLCYWNDAYKCFTTLRPVAQSEIFSFPCNLSEEHQEVYRREAKGKRSSIKGERV